MDLVFLYFCSLIIRYVFIPKIKNALNILCIWVGLHSELNNTKFSVLHDTKNVKAGYRFCRKGVTLVPSHIISSQPQQVLSKINPSPVRPQDVVIQGRFFLKWLPVFSYWLLLSLNCIVQYVNPLFMFLYAGSWSVIQYKDWLCALCYWCDGVFCEWESGLIFLWK